MRNFIILAAVIGVLVWVGRTYAPQLQTTVSTAGGSVSRGTVDQIRREPNAVMDMQDAMTGGGTSAKAMLDTARGAGR